MMATKCAPLVGLATPSLSSVAKETKASCILPESSWRSRRRLTPVLHIRLLEVACAPPLANIRPICAFHAQTSMRTSGLSLQPGALPGKGSAATLEATDGLSAGKPTDLHQAHLRVPRPDEHADFRLVATAGRTPRQGKRRHVGSHRWIERRQIHPLGHGGFLYFRAGGDFVQNAVLLQAVSHQPHTDQSDDDPAALFDF